MSLARKCTETGQGHDGSGDVKATKGDGPLHLTDEGLVLSNPIWSQEIAGVEFWVIALLEGRVDPGVGSLPKFPEVGIEHLVNVLFGGHAQDAIVVAEEVTAEMEGDGASPFEFELVHVDECIHESLWVLH